MDGCPRGVFDVRAADGVQESCRDEVVEGGVELIEWPSLVGSCTGRVVISRRECGVEEAWLIASTMR